MKQYLQLDTTINYSLAHLGRKLFIADILSTMSSSAAFIISVHATTVKPSIQDHDAILANHNFIIIHLNLIAYVPIVSSTTNYSAQLNLALSFLITATTSHTFLLQMLLVQQPS